MIDFKLLREPFYPDELEWKPQSVGKSGGKFWVRALAYVTNRAIMDRLDEVVGPGSWQNEFKAGPDGGVLCGLSVKVGNEWVTKWDGADNTDIEAVKGGLSGSMKRAAVHWGIGRYLYDLEENFGKVEEAGIYRAKTKEGEWFTWSPPKLPAWAIPGGASKKVRQETPPRESAGPETSKLDEVKAWLNTHHEKLKTNPEAMRSIRAQLAEAGEDVQLLDAVIVSAKNALGIS